MDFKQGCKWWVSYHTAKAITSEGIHSFVPCNAYCYLVIPLSVCVYCVYSNSHNDVRRVAQGYRTIAAHTRRLASVLVVFVVFCVQMHSFAGLIRRTPPSTFSDTAITNHHSDTTIFQPRAHWVRISWSIGSEKSLGHVPPGGSQTLDFQHARRAPYPLGQALRFVIPYVILQFFI